MGTSISLYRRKIKILMMRRYWHHISFKLSCVQTVSDVIYDFDILYFMVRFYIIFLLSQVHLYCIYDNVTQAVDKYKVAS